MQFRSPLAFLLIAALLAGCSGASSSSLPSVPKSGPGTNTKHGTVVFKIKIPKRDKHHHHLKPRFISPATQGMTIAIGGPTAVTSTVALTPSSTGCNSSLASTVCTFSYNLAPGSYTGTFKTYDAVTCTSSCSIPGTANELSAAQSTAFTITAGQDNQINMTLSAVPATIQVLPLTELSILNLSQGIDLLGTGSRKLLVQALDADGNVIFGAGSPTFSIAQTGGTLTLTIVQPTSTAPNVFSVKPPSSYSANTATLTVTAGYAGGLTNGCSQTGAVCSAAVTFDMKELLAVANNNNTVALFQVGATTPYVTLSFGISNPNAIAFDSSGNLLVANCLQGCANGSSSDNIAIFAPPYSGTPTFITNGISGPKSMLVDAGGNLFVGNCVSCTLGGTDSVTEYTPPFSSSSSPKSTTSSGIINPVALAMDGSNNLWVANCASACGLYSGTDTVTYYASPYGNSPTKTLTQAVSGGAPQSLAIDASNDVFVATPGNGDVVEYTPPTYTDNAVTTTQISTIGATYNGGTLCNPLFVSTDGSGNLLVADDGCSSGAVLQCDPPITSNTCTSTNTVTSGVNLPVWLTLDGAGNLFAANAGSNRVTAYVGPAYGSHTTLNPGSTPFAMAILP